jgi:hypothetical protein
LASLFALEARERVRCDMLIVLLDLLPPSTAALKINSGF